MCFKRKYKIYHSKRRSLKIVITWHAFPSHSIPMDDCDDLKPILLTKKVPFSIAQELAVKHGTCFILDTIDGTLGSITVFKIYSKAMAEDLVQNYNSRVVVPR